MNARSLRGGIITEKGTTALTSVAAVIDTSPHLPRSVAMIASTTTAALAAKTFMIASLVTVEMTSVTPVISAENALRLGLTPNIALCIVAPRLDITLSVNEPTAQMQQVPLRVGGRLRRQEIMGVEEELAGEWV